VLARRPGVRTRGSPIKRYKAHRELIGNRKSECDGGEVNFDSGSDGAGKTDLSLRQVLTDFGPLMKRRNLWCGNAIGQRSAAARKANEASRRRKPGFES